MTFFAVIPAAGKSLRMGSEHKLLLEWPRSDSKAKVLSDGSILTDSCGRWTVLHNVLNAWKKSQVDRICIVLRSADRKLARIAEQFGVDVATLANDVPQMKDSICAGLRYLEQSYAPQNCDFCLVSPADIPMLQPVVIDRVIAGAFETESPVVPCYRAEHCGEVALLEPGKRGHPIAMPWNLMRETHGLKEDQGLNVLLDRYADSTVWVDLPLSLKPTDIDTPEEYQQLLGRQREQSS